jgi:two-component system, chemotaxis family, protein-glutamate methylesterase/glutaminase
VTTRNLVVIGASAGGVEALRALVAELPEDLPAAVLVVLHLRSGGTSALAHILDRSGRLPAVTASPRQDLRRGTIVVAPPDHHLLVDDGQYVLSRGPTESGHRPAVDALFRSAARAAGARVIAVVLSGVLDDGAAGAVAVARRGGLVAIQDPTEALYPGMPEAVAELITPDHVLPAAALGTMLGRRAGEPVELAGTPPPSELESREANIARHGEHSVAHDLAELGELAGYACPDCDGGLLLLSGTERMRCRVGHAWTAEALLAAQADRTEKALWTAYRMLEERAELAIRLEELARGRDSDAMVRRHADEGREAREAAAVLRTLLLTEVPEHRTVTRPAPKADPVST